MSGQIDLLPEVLNLSLYAGDGIQFRLVCKNPSGVPVDITGAVRAQIRADRISTASPIVSFAVNLIDAYQGIVRLSLTGAQTQQLIASGSGGSFSGVWDVEWTPAGSQPRTLCQGNVECVADVTR